MHVIHIVLIWRLIWKFIFISYLIADVSAHYNCRCFCTLLWVHQWSRVFCNVQLHIMHNCTLFNSFSIFMHILFMKIPLSEIYWLFLKCNIWKLSSFLLFFPIAFGNFVYPRYYIIKFPNFSKVSPWHLYKRLDWPFTKRSHFWISRVFLINQWKKTQNWYGKKIVLDVSAPCLHECRNIVWQLL